MQEHVPDHPGRSWGCRPETEALDKTGPVQLVEFSTLLSPLRIFLFVGENNPITAQTFHERRIVLHGHQ